MSAAKRKAESPARVGWFSLLAIGTIVVVAGFAVGLVAGVTWEEPGLVIGWLTGETDGIEWGVESADFADTAGDERLDRLDRRIEPDAAPDVAAPPPLPPLGARREGSRVEGATAAVAPEPIAPEAVTRPSAPVQSAKVESPVQPAATASAKPAATPSAPKVAAATPPAPATGFSVQVGAFAERGAAEQLANSLRGDGYRVYVFDAGTADGGKARWRVRVGPHRTREDADGIAKRLETSRKLPTWVLGESS